MLPVKCNKKKRKKKKKRRRNTQRTPAELDERKTQAKYSIFVLKQKVEFITFQGQNAFFAPFLFLFLIFGFVYWISNDEHDTKLCAYSIYIGQCSEINVIY